MTDIRQITRSSLRQLPWRPWDMESTYDTLLLFPAPEKHESGWQNMTLIGCNERKAVELLTTSCDDLEIQGAHKIDCVPGARAFHIWKPQARFTVSADLSSMIVLVKNGARP